MTEREKALEAIMAEEGCDSLCFILPGDTCICRGKVEAALAMPATERTAWEAGRDVAADMLSSMCPKCGGEGWLWGHELVEPPDVEGYDDTRYSCDSEVHEYAAAIRALTPPEDKE
jgi:hypothetical protein